MNSLLCPLKKKYFRKIIHRRTDIFLIISIQEMYNVNEYLHYFFYLTNGIEIIYLEVINYSAFMNITYHLRVFNILIVHSVNSFLNLFSSKIINDFL